MKFKNLLITFLLVSATMHAASLKNYTIKIKIAQLKNTDCLLSYHFGDKKYIKDTARFDNNGVATFKQKGKLDSLKGGIYLAVFPSLGNKYIEFLVNEKESLIEIETDTMDLGGKMKVIASEENKIFNEDIFYLAATREKIEPLGHKLQGSKNETEKTDLRNQLRKLEEDIKAHRINIINTKPHLLYSSLLSLMREVDVPDAPKDAKGRMIDSNFQYNYYKSHYWQYTNFNDDRILRTPIFEPKFKTYFDKVVIKHPDTLIKECDFILGSIKDKNSDMWNYCLVTLLNDYANSNIMGMDAVYVHLVEKYYAKGLAPWVDSAQIKKIVERAAALKPLLIGKVAPNVQAFDTTLVKPYQLYDSKSEYTVLYFWNPDCGHCKTTTPQLNNITDSLKMIGAGVFGVTTANYEEIKMWKDFTNDHKLKFLNVGDPYFKNQPHFRLKYDIQSTPQVYVLDKYYRIIGKRLAVDQLYDFISNHKKGKM
jgi:thiol-disulfide isomerase/thioredoxin